MENERIAIYSVIINSHTGKSESSIEYFDNKAKTSSIVREALKKIRKLNFGNICAREYYGMDIIEARKIAEENENCTLGIFQ
ncbi:hypothetical protein [Clostridium grantii]|uniref:Uncharacterized protein n=1 Tax=Clostridium grantii DSM 8605 TaxID=1121316 RepID=A0A1M5Y5X1_9CLOT|nr:hypothetical protein [Clostridium grantii]SHI07481.1 hypothetical protein SAMN02745207_04226 [Clostridium grantii DSM 8605]